MGLSERYEEAGRRRWRAIFGTAALIVLFAVALYPLHANSAPIDPDNVTVIDGDTIRLNQMRPDVRLVGLNTPETRRAQCAAERELGGKATRRLRDLVSAGKLDFEYVACACRPGTEGTDACNFGRRCGVLKAGGRDVAAILIDEKLAVPFICSGTGCPPTPRPWCE